MPEPHAIRMRFFLSDMLELPSVRVAGGRTWARDLISHSSVMARFAGAVPSVLSAKKRPPLG